MVITDLHTHTKISPCGTSEPEKLIQTAIDGGINVLGICDHAHGVRNKTEYFKLLDGLKTLYQDKIKIVRGIEIATVPQRAMQVGTDVSFFDYCLIEHIDQPESVVKDFIEYAKRLKTKVGIAHTDLFAFIKRKNYNAEEYLTNLKNNGIFWELNVSCDSVHNYREHAYVKEFLSSYEQQSLIKKVGLEVSVASDCHDYKEYDAEKIKSTCILLHNLGIISPKF